MSWFFSLSYSINGIYYIFWKNEWININYGSVFELADWDVDIPDAHTFDLNVVLNVLFHFLRDGTLHVSHECFAFGF